MKKLLSMVLTMLMLLSVICIAPVSVGAAEVNVAQTSATVSSDGTARLYFNMNAVSWWNAASSGGGNFAYFFNNSTGKNAWSTKAVQYSGNTYYITIPAGNWAGVVLTRNSVTSGANWNNKWNQTGDITLSSTSNYLSKFADNSASVTWGTAVKLASTASVTASAAEVTVGTTANLTAALTSNAALNTIKSTTYSVEPETATVTDGVFAATVAGEYTVTATVTYYPNGYSSLTSTATATTTISVTAPAEPDPTEAPATDAPATEAPATEAPVATDAPATEAPATDAPEANTITIYFENNWNWPEVSIYTWGGAAGENATWPGEVMTEIVGKNGDGVYDIYKMEIPADNTGIIFSGEGSYGRDQSADVTDIKDGYVYYMTYDSATNTKPCGSYEYAPAATPDPTEAPATDAPTTDAPATDAPVVEKEYKTIYFSNAWMWTDVTVYFWGSAFEATPEWPGVAMTFVEKNDFGQEIYKTTVPADATGMLFAGKDNGNDTKSPDITDIKDGYGYYMDWNETDGTHVGMYEYVAPVDPATPDETTPATDAPATDAPATEAPATDAPATDAPVVEKEYKTIYFTNAWMWTDVTVYFWGSAFEATPEWPGVAMTFVEKNDFGQEIYKATVPADATGMLFAGKDNGNDTKSPDITDIKDGYGYYMDWNETDGTHVGMYEYVPVVPTTPDETTPATDAPATETPEEVEPITIFFQNNWNWSDVKIYFWGSETYENPSWPGVSMDYYDNDGTYDYYSYNLPADIDGFLINGIKDDGSGELDKTPDIVDGYYNNICYYMLWNDGNTVGSAHFDDIFVPYAPEEPSTEDEIIPAPDLVGSTVTLGGNLGVNFWFQIDDEAIFEDENAKVIINIPNSGSYTQVEIPVSEGINADGWFVFTAEVAAKEMTSTIDVQLVATDYETNVYSYTVKEYCEYILANPDVYPEEQALVKALLNYGAASQAYFGYNTDDFANDTEYMTEDEKTYNYVDLSAYAPVIEGEGEGDIIKYYGASLVLESETALKFYFTVDETRLPEGVTPAITVNGLPGATLEKNGNMYVLKIDYIAAHELGDAFTLAIGNGCTINFSALSYAFNAQQKTDKPALVDVANALAAFSVAATAYNVGVVA